MVRSHTHLIAGRSWTAPWDPEFWFQRLAVGRWSFFACDRGDTERWP